MFASMLTPTTAVTAAVQQHKRRQHHEVSQQVMSEQADDALVDSSDMLLEDGAVGVPSAAVDAAAASAEEVVKAAEQEEATSLEAPHHDTAQHVRGLSNAASQVQVKHKDVGRTSGSKTEDGEDADDEEDDDSDYDTDQADADYDTEQAATTAAPQHGEVLESYTPEGRYARARELLQENLKQQADNANLTVYLSNSTIYEARVDSEADQVADESGATALASLLGTVRKEMHKFAAPFYLQYLAREMQRLKAEEPQLQANVEAARVALYGGATTVAPKFLPPYRPQAPQAQPQAQPLEQAPVPSRAVVTIAHSLAPAVRRPSLLACAIALAVAARL
jgi:hypothetical protein